MRPGERQKLVEALSPPADQLALLDAIFSPEEEFASKFEAWRRACKGAPGLESAVLWPLVVPRLGKGGDGDRLRDQCREAYRLCWAKNALMRGRLARIVAPALAAGSQPILLKGNAIARHYAAGRLRGFGDTDILVAPERVTEVIRAYLAQGWTSPKFASPELFDPRFAHAIELHGPEGDVLDLHCQPFHHWIGWNRDMTLLEREAVPFGPSEAGLLGLRTLRREHHLLHLVANALASREASGKWIADIIALVESGDMDWQLLERDSRALGIGPLVGVALEQVSSFTQAIPPGVARRLEQQKAPARLFAFGSWLYSDDWITRFGEHGAVLLIGGAGGSWLRAICSVPAYLRFCLARRGLRQRSAA